MNQRRQSVDVLVVVVLEEGAEVEGRMRKTGGFQVLFDNDFFCGANELSV